MNDFIVTTFTFEVHAALADDQNFYQGKLQPDEYPVLPERRDQGSEVGQ